jgi:hypothetical protein
MKENLELRMYGLVNYQLSGTIHAGIQYGHAVVEYGQQYGHTLEYKKWAEEDKTFIILNGGTTNNNEYRLGTLNKHLLNISTNTDIRVSSFHEPDLGDQLTAFVFLVDERVFNRDEYPDFKPYLEDLIGSDVIRDCQKKAKSKNREFILEEYFKAEYDVWLELIGGKRNAFLKDFLKSLKLA